ncbi:MAG: flagellar hook-associated protein FlgK [Gammaproteobacteria bacterium]|nr:flagellar hook-associated protein FlgK [Gammaproteobacteria bacterium]
MADLLNNAVSGLVAFQRALSTTSHNIANVNTPGYSRQSVEFVTNPPSFFGGSYFGNGVNIESVTRAYDQFLTAEVRNSTSIFTRSEKFSELAGYIDDLLADPHGGISPIMHSFFESVQDVADDPASSTARYALINTAETLAGRFQSFDQRLEDLTRDTGAEIRSVVEEINSLVSQIHEINVTLNEFAPSAASTQQSADLLDRRDALLNQLSQKVDITVVDETENNLSIFIGNGQTMLSGISAFTLGAQPNPGDPTQDVITYNGLINVFDISSNLTGGELGALLDFRGNVLQPTRNSLGRTAIGLAETFNAQMRDGMDLNGNLGQDFFSYAAPQSTAFSTNLGTPTVSTVISDVTALTTDNYELAFDGANWTLTSNSGSSATVANGAPATLVFEGLTLTINGATAVAGDQFTIKPTQPASGGMQVLTSDPNEIAAALPIRSNASPNNLGNVDISAGIVTDVTDPNLLNTATLTFDNPPTTLRADVNVVVGGVPYVAGAAIPFSNNMLVDANGWQVNLNGAPQAGDQFTIESNVGGSGDNRNALNLANLQNLGVFDGGVATYQEDYGTLVGFVGSQTMASMLERDAQESLLLQAIDRQSSKASVNLDEEAADLVRYQQAYEATARLISTAQTIFETLLNSVR